MGMFGDSLDKAALQQRSPAPLPSRRGAQMQYLVKQLKGTKAVAQLLGVSQRTVERYVKDQIKQPRPDLAARLEPRGHASGGSPRSAPRRKQTGGHHRRHRHRHPRPLRLHRRPRHHRRRPASATSPGACRPHYAARLFDAQDAGATEQQLQEIAAEGLQEIYFQDGGRRAHGLLVEFTDIDYLDVDY